MGPRREHYAATKDDQVTVTGHVDDYKGMLASHKFCGALPGDGWSGGFESYVFAGCIPVVIMDGVLQPFETHLDFSKFTVRIQGVLRRCLSLFTPCLMRRRWGACHRCSLFLFARRIQARRWRRRGPVRRSQRGA